MLSDTRSPIPTTPRPMLADHEKSVRQELHLRHIELPHRYRGPVKRIIVVLTMAMTVKVRALERTGWASFCVDDQASHEISRQETRRQSPVPRTLRRAHQPGRRSLWT